MFRKNHNKLVTAIITIAVLLSLCVPALAAESGEDVEEITTFYSIEGFANEVARLVNVQRHIAGLELLATIPSLASAAELRAIEIGQVFSHTRPDGRGPFTVLDEFDVPSWSHAGENIAIGQQTPAQVVQSWMNSPGHRAAILNSNYNAIGTGVTRCPQNRTTWVQLFAGLRTPPTSPRVSTQQFVSRMFRLSLQREPDTAGLNFWTNQLLLGNKTGTELGRDFMFSAEMNSRNLSNAQFVDILYDAFLGRPADAAGREHWLHLMASGVTRMQVFNSFAGSPEFAGIAADYGILR